MKIVGATVTQGVKSQYDTDLPKVIVRFSNGSVKELFTFYPNEIMFKEAEFIGLTEEEAHTLKAKKDVAYLNRKRSA